MSERPTIQQILSDPRSADRVALDYCNGEMATCLKRVDALDAENRALREFVAVVDEAMNEVFGQRDWWTVDPEVWGTDTSEPLLAARNRLAAEHGLPLPGAGEAS